MTRGTLKIQDVFAKSVQGRDTIMTYKAYKVIFLVVESSSLRNVEPKDIYDISTTSFT